MKDLVIFGIGALVGVVLAMIVVRNAVNKGVDRWSGNILKSIIDAPPQDTEIGADRL